MITYNSEAVKLPKFSKRDVSKWIKEVAAVYGKKVGEIGYLFCDDNKILEVNKQYLNHDYFTDIITFSTSFINSRQKGRAFRGNIFTQFSDRYS